MPLEEALSCIRLLTRLLPVLLESEAQDLENSIFWTEEPDGQDLLGKKFTQAVVDLLFVPGFTLPAASKPQSEGIVFYTLWESGIGGDAKAASSEAILSYRLEVLRLLLVLISKSMYIVPGPYCLIPEDLHKSTNHFLVFLTRNLNRNAATALFCSLFNSIIKFSHLLQSHFSEKYATACCHCLIGLLDYAELPAEAAKMEDSDSTKSDSSKSLISKTKNLFLGHLQKLHRNAEYEMLLSSFTSLLSDPMNASSTKIMGSAKEIEFYPEVLMILWKCLEYNPGFQQYAMQSEKCLSLLVALIFYIYTSRHVPSNTGLLHLSVFILMLMSSDRNFSVKLNHPFQENVSFIQIGSSAENYFDFLCLSILSFLHSSKWIPQTLVDCLLSVLCNVTPFVKSMSLTCSDRLVSLFVRLGSSYLLFSDQKVYRFCCFLLEVFNHSIQYQFDGIRQFHLGNSNLIYSILRMKEKFIELHNLTFEVYSAKIGNTKEQAISEEQFHSAKAGLFTDVLNNLILMLAPEIDKHSLSMESYGETEVLNFLRSGTLVGLLPAPPPISIRRYQSNQGIIIWFTSYVFGMIYLHHTNPPIWYGTSVKLFQVKSGMTGS